MQHTNETSRNTFLFSIYDGTFRRKSILSDPPEKIIERPNINTGATYREVIIKGLSGFIDNLQIYTNKKGDDMFQVVLSCEDEFYSIRMHPKSKEAERFCVTLPNINLKRMVYLEPNKFIGKDAKTKIGLLVLQDESPVAPHNTLKEPNGLPMLPPERYDASGRLSDSDYNELKAQRVAFFKSQFLKYAENLKAELK